jgi:hypothetical protein
MQTCVHVRDICAHHDQLRNVGVGFDPPTPTSLDTAQEAVSLRRGRAGMLPALVCIRPPTDTRGTGVHADGTDDRSWRRHVDRLPDQRTRHTRTISRVRGGTTTAERLDTGRCQWDPVPMRTWLATRQAEGLPLLASRRRLTRVRRDGMRRIGPSA